MTRRARLGFLAAVAAVTIGAGASSVSAIIGGTPDGSGHPNVGGLVNDTQYSDGTWLYCSGTLIADDVFVTAAHCADDGARVRVTFDTAYTDGDKVHRGTFHADPAYGWSQDDPHDLAVVVLDKPVHGVEPATLPDAGAMDQLAAGQQFTSVGYGAYEVANGPGGKSYRYDDVRMVATGTLNSVNPAWLRISMNAARGDGGTCYGDSGGPNFVGDTDVVAAVTVTGDAVCRATNVTYRLDTASARAFLGQFVELP